MVATQSEASRGIRTQCVRTGLWVLIVLGAGACGKKSGEAKTECVNPRLSMAGCCLGHGGGEKCGEGKYRFQGERLVCDDGTLSDTCRR